MKNYTIEQIQAVMKKKGYRFFEENFRPYNLNLIGIRSNNQIPNLFDDQLCVIWFYKGGKSIEYYKITTDPGSYWLLDKDHKGNPNGTAILKPGQYTGLWEIGLHRGKYEALVQKVPCTVIRDTDRDNTIDFNSPVEETGIFGINCHHAGEDSEFVDEYSAGCQTFKTLADFNKFMDTCRKSRDVWGNSFTYTLLEERDFV